VALPDSSSTTTRIYNPYRGWLDAKRHADDKGPDYTCTAAGRLESRTWARGITTTYGYHNAGDLETVDCCENTPDVAYTHDRRGRRSQTSNPASQITFTCNDANRLLIESHTGRPLDQAGVNHNIVLIGEEAVSRLGARSEWNPPPTTPP
jgi:YD repeat-containing protein